MLQASVPKFALHLCAKRFPAFQMIATNTIWILCEERKWSSLKATLILTKFTNGQWASAVADVQFNLMLTTHSLAQVGWNNLQELRGKTPKNWSDKKKKKREKNAESPKVQIIRWSVSLRKLLMHYASQTQLNRSWNWKFVSGNVMPSTTPPLPAQQESCQNLIKNNTKKMNRFSSIQIWDVNSF